MDAGVVGHRTDPALDIDLQLQLHAFFQHAVDDFHMMHKLLVRRLLDVEHLAIRFVAGHRAAVGHLSAAFGVEAGTIEDDLALIFQHRDAHAVFKQSGNRSGITHCFIAREFKRRCEVHQIRRLAGHRLRVFARGPGAFTLLRHLRLKAFFIDRITALAGDFFCQLQREAVGIVQLEDDLAAQGFRRFSFGQLLIEQLFTVGQRRMERFFLILNQLGDKFRLF